jgi:amidase
MVFTRPTAADLREAAARLRIDIPDDDFDYYRGVVDGSLAQLERIHELEEPALSDLEFVEELNEPKGVDRPSYRPLDSENPHNAWITRCDVSRDVAGPLAGTTVGLKDSIALANVEMTCGSTLLEGYVPDVDATVVDRLLSAGARIVGKCNMESFAFSASSDTSDFGTVTNPEDPTRIAGGSSSGSAAAVAADEVDVALGSDQGASVRVPAACCGVVGLDPTPGLVPNTGVFPMDPTIDNVGPIARSTRAVAETLDVISGADNLDPRQPLTLRTDDYTATLGEPVDDLRIGVLEEGFAVEGTDPRVVDVVVDAIESYERLGVETTNVSLPAHVDAVSLGFMIWAYGAFQTFKNGGQGALLEGWYDTRLMDAFGKRRRDYADDLSKQGKATLVTMQYLSDRYSTATYGKAQNLRYGLRQEIDGLLSSVDLLALPTMPVVPFELDADESAVERATNTITLCRNTATSSLTANPSISVPCGTVDGVPVGLLLVADSYEEQTLLRAADAFERL